MPSQVSLGRAKPTRVCLSFISHSRRPGPLALARDDTNQIGTSDLGVRRNLDQAWRHALLTLMPTAASGLFSHRPVLAPLPPLPITPLTDLSLFYFRAALDAKKQKTNHASAAPDTPPAVEEAVAN